MEQAHSVRADTRCVTQQACRKGWKVDVKATDKKIGVVVGGGNGIGAACCKLMAERGWKVVVADLDEGSAKAVSEEIGAHACAVDIRDHDAVERLAADIESDVGPVHALVVAAAAFQDRCTAFEATTDQFRNVFAVNSEAVFALDRAFGKAMVRRRSGSIVNMASAVVYGSSPVHAYGASKAAVVSLTRTLAVEWGRAGVRVNSVSPGSTLVERQLTRKSDPRFTTDPIGTSALGRKVLPREVAEGVEFLASERASAITGIDLLIDGGFVPASMWGFYGGVPAAEDP